MGGGGGGVGRITGRNQKHMSREVEESGREKPAGVLLWTAHHNKLHSKVRLEDCDDLTKGPRFVCACVCMCVI